MITTTTEAAYQSAGEAFPVAHLQLQNVPACLQELTKEVYYLALDRLLGIVDRFIEWDDPLSRELINWSFEVLGPIIEGIELNSEFEEDVNEQMRRLSYDILANHNGGQLPHEFADEITRWINSLPLQTIPPVRPVIVVASYDNAAILAITKYFGAELKADEDGLELIREMRVDMEARMDHQRVVWRQTREINRSSAGQWRLEAEKHTQRLIQNIDAIEQAHQSTAKLLVSMINQQKEQIRETNQRLNTAENTNLLQEGEIRELHDKFSQRLQEISASSNNHKHKKNCIVM